MVIRTNVRPRLIVASMAICRRMLITLESVGKALGARIENTSSMMI